MAKPTQRDLSELIDLVTDLAGVTLTDVRKLCEAGDALRRASGSLRVPKPSDVVAELQESFRRLTQCVFLVRDETERLESIARTGPGKGPRRSTSDSHDG